MIGRGLMVCGAVVAFVLADGAACACSIPVFRYALERWPADAFRIEVTVPEPLRADDRAALIRLEDGAARNGGTGNYVVERVAGATEDPQVTIRDPREATALWQGPLADADDVVSAGPVQRALVSRLLAGDAVVWLVVPGADDRATERAITLLEAELPLAASDTVLPRGIGLPGSELLSDVPLEARFSVLVVDPAAADARLLRRTLAARMPGKDAGWEGVALVAPVFGRGRVARVIRADDLDADLVTGVTAFLCGACSCQAKQLAPGFDLLVEAAWDERLFGGEPPESPPVAPVRAPPRSLTIPPGFAPERGR